MINILNRNSNTLGLTADSFNTFRYFDPSKTIKQLEYLADQGCRNLKICDEMFVYIPKHFMSLCDLIIERFGEGYWNCWAYSRINTIRPQYLDKLKRAGINHVALGIEVANQNVRQEIDKGMFKEINIREVVKMCEDHDIDVGANFICGLPGEDYNSLQQTLSLALELNCMNMNVYCSTSICGSAQYQQNKLAGKRIPVEYDEFGFLSYNHVPDSTEFLSSKEVLEFRDYFFNTYFTNPCFHDKLRKKYGDQAVNNVKKLTSVRIKRKLLGD